MDIVLTVVILMVQEWKREAQVRGSKVPAPQRTLSERNQLSDDMVIDGCADVFEEFGLGRFSIGRWLEYGQERRFRYCDEHSRLYGVPKHLADDDGLIMFRLIVDHDEFGDEPEEVAEDGEHPRWAELGRKDLNENVGDP